MFTKKGQGLSLNVIIIAALALIVLVVLIVVFTGRISIFESGVSAQGNSELVKMKIFYGDCHPTSANADTFVSAYNIADQAGSTVEKELAKSDFDKRVSECKALSVDKNACETGGCKWK